MVTTARWLELTATILGRGGESRSTDTWAAASGDVLGVAGAGIVVMRGRGTGPLCASDPAAHVLENLQYTLGEGPCVDAFRTGNVVSEDDVDANLDRWPAFTPPLVQAGMGAVFAFPLALGGARLGALTLYQQPPGPLAEKQQADALAVAQIASLAILEMQAGTPPDRWADGLAEVVSCNAEIHQASGMVAVQLGIGVDAAFVRLRAYADAEGHRLADVAADVVARRLRFTHP
jgi:hypothetical protein